MKKVMLLTLLFCILTIDSFAHGFFSPCNHRSKYHLSIWGGIANTRLTSNSAYPVFGPYDKTKMESSFGATAEIFITDLFSIESGIFYMRSGGRSAKQVGTDDQGNKLGEFYFMQDLKYLQIPITLKMNFNTKFVQPFLFVGPNLGLLLSAHEKFKPDYKTSINYDEDITNKLHPYNLGLDIGLGLTYPLFRQVSIALAGKYSYGLIDQVKDSSVDGSQKSRDLLFLTGLSVGL